MVRASSWLASRGEGCPPPRPLPGLCEVARPGHLVDVDSDVLVVREHAGGLLCRAEDRIHAGNLAVVAEVMQRIPAGMSPDTMASSSVRPQLSHSGAIGQWRVASRFTMPVSSSRAGAMPRPR